MKNKKRISIMFLLTIVLTVHQNAGAQESQVQVPNIVVGNGGEALSDSTQRFVITVGQPFAGIMNGSSNASIGFWNVVMSVSSTEVIENVEGDTTGDGVVDVADLVRLINVILGIGPPPTDAEREAADLNHDGVLDVNDLVIIINIILGLG